VDFILEAEELEGGKASNDADVDALPKLFNLVGKRIF
jgi:hypothetical protein